MSAATKKPAAKSRRVPMTPREPAHNEIALCAMAIWMEEGRPDGRDLEHWLRAEARLRQALQAEADAASGSPSRRSTRNGARHTVPQPAAL